MRTELIIKGPKKIKWFQSIASGLNNYFKRAVDFRLHHNRITVNQYDSSKASIVEMELSQSFFWRFATNISPDQPVHLCIDPSELQKIAIKAGTPLHELRIDIKGDNGEVERVEVKSKSDITHEASLPPLISQYDTDNIPSISIIPDVSFEINPSGLKRILSDLESVSNHFSIMVDPNQKAVVFDAEQGGSELEIDATESASISNIRGEKKVKSVYSHEFYGKSLLFVPTKSWLTENYSIPVSFGENKPIQNIVALKRGGFVGPEITDFSIKIVTAPRVERR